MASHARVPLLVKALDEHGVPAVAGKQGLLMFRPVIQTLMSLLWLLTLRTTRLLRWQLLLAIVGMKDSEVISHFKNSEVISWKIYPSVRKQMK